MEWWKTAGPLIGVVLGIVATLISQALSDRRASQRDRLRAAEEAKIRLRSERVSIQRESIMEIQHGLEAVWALYSVAPDQQVSEPLRTTATSSGLRLNAHIARLDDRDLAASVRRILEQPENEGETIRSALDDLQIRLSDRLHELYAEAAQ